MTPLVTPTIHLNGTCAHELVHLRIDVMNAAQALLDAMNKAAPNARDYYPQGKGVAAKAREAWVERMKQVEQLLNDVQMDAMKIALGVAE